MGIHAVTPLITAASMLALGVAVMLRERGSPAARTFLGLACAVAVWQSMFAAAYVATDPAAALLRVRLAYLGVPLIAPAMYSFTAHLLNLQRERRATLRAGWALGVMFAVVSVSTDALVAGVYRHFWGYYPRLGWAGVPYLVYFGGMLVLAMREYWTHLRRAQPGRFRARVRWVMVAFGIAYVAVLDYLPAYGVEAYPIGSLPMMVFLGMTAWAIRHHRLVDLTPSFAAEQILATVADPVLVVDTQGRIRVANGAVGAVFGHAEGALIDAPVETLAAPGSPEASRLRRLLEASTVRDEEMCLRSRGGGSIDVSVSASPLAGPGGERAGTVLIARDVRESKAARDALRQSEERSRSLIENISDAIVVLDAGGRVLFASPSLARVTGYLPQERVGRSSLELLHPADRPSVAAALAAGIHQAGATFRHEFRLQHRDGSWRDVEATATNLLHDPAVGGVIVAYHDVTERRGAEEALRASQEQLQHSQKMEAVGRLAGGIAHDFNNLLTIINGHGELLREAVEHDPEALAMLGEVQSAGRRASGLTRQLLTFSRKQVVQPKLLDLGATVRDLEDMLRRLIGEDVRFVAHADGVLGRVRADPGQIEQVVLNLAVNARDAMPDGGTLTVAISDAELDAADLPPDGEAQPGDYVELVVSDTGTGMSREVQERIFEPFYTTKEQGKGTGLGLSTVYGIVRQSGGHVRVESGMGRGTTFRIYLPSVPGGAEAEVPLAALPESEAPVCATVLLAEDDASVRALARQVLVRRGYTVVEASNGMEALRVADGHAGPIDLLLTDVVMPELGGRDLAERFQAARPEAAVLYMSGYTDDALGRHGVLEEGVTLLQKPFSPSALLDAVRVSLAAAETRAAALP